MSRTLGQIYDKDDMDEFLELTWEGAMGEPGGGLMLIGIETLKQLIADEQFHTLPQERKRCRPSVVVSVSTKCSSPCCW